jgi:hypothetical protein
MMPMALTTNSHRRADPQTDEQQDQMSGEVMW